MKYTLKQTDVFSKWLAGLKDKQALKAINMRLVRAAGGNLGDVKSLGNNISEVRIYVGKGYRLYFTKRGKELILLINGGDKSSQTRDIAKANELLDSLRSSS